MKIKLFENFDADEMYSEYRTIMQIIENESECPFPIDVIPNEMGINLCSVKGISWIKQPDGQLVNVMIHFKPANKDTE